MAEYIELDAAIALIREQGIYGDYYSDAEREENVIDMLESLPAVEVAPVVHGRWVVLDECSNEGAYCSVCNKKVYKVCYGNCKMRSKFCPNCGADMREG